MKIETRVFGALALFYIPVGIVYGVMTKWHEPLGVVALFLTTGMAGLIAVYLAFTARHIDPRPEDDFSGEIAEHPGELGFFPPRSWWPMALSFSLALFVAGVATGWWLMLITLPLVVLATIGWVFEYYRGEYAH